MEKKNSRPIGKKKRNLFVPIFIVVIMILSGAGYLWRQDETTQGTKITYKGIDFIQNDLGYSAIINGKNIMIASNPLNLSDFPKTPESLLLESLTSSEKIYFSFDPKEDISSAVRELSNLGLPSKIIQSTYYDNLSIEYDLPLKTCNEAAFDGKVIIIKNQEPNKILYEPNCITLQGKGINLTRVTDKFVMDLLIKE